MPSTRSTTVAFGPTLPDWGSWQSVGEDLRQELAGYFETSSFDARDIPESDIAFFVKFAPPLDLVEHVTRRGAVIYAPVDYYGSPAEIDAAARMLRKCSRILIHCERLRKCIKKRLCSSAGRFGNCCRGAGSVCVTSELSKKCWQSGGSDRRARNERSIEQPRALAASDRHQICPAKSGRTRTVERCLSQEEREDRGNRDRD